MDEASIGKEGESLIGETAGKVVSRSPWNPCRRVFRPYSSSQPSAGIIQKSSSLRVIVKRPLVVRLTKDIVETYQTCNPAFKYSDSFNPKRFLTNPSVGVLNDGFDNANSDLILTVNFVLENGSQQRYVVKDILGQGTFGQVAKCWVSETNSFVAVKIIKNQPAYYQQALVEVSILRMLNQKFDPEDKQHIVRILDYFVYQRHLCISFEMLGSNLFELIRMNQFRGMSLNIVQLFSKQILYALLVMKDAGIIHCDLKPENILISTSMKPPEIKIIDFGSACMEDRTVYSYIQSRYYRSPEVLLGYPYTTAIDMWSFGCIVAELFLGLPLFPGASEFDLLKRMIEILGGQPPDHILKDANNTNKFFKRMGSIHHFEEDEECNGSRSAYQVLTEEEFEARESKKPVIGKRYFNYVRLEEIVANYPHRRNLPDEEISRENLTRLALIDFLRGLVEFDPVKRWSPLQAVQHPFVTGEPFTCPYKPLPETPRKAVSHNITVEDHNPGGGHWFVAGLSPQVAKMSKGHLQNSPHFQMAPFSHAGSYGSLGSHGSYNDSVGLGGSYGSYGDSNMYMYYSSVGPSGLNIHQAQGGGPILGASPDARRRTCQPPPHGNGFGASPSTGTFGPMSLGASPSQFTPPSSQFQVSAGSPGKYGPSSPARGTVHGSPLGKVAAVGQYNRRRSLGYPGTYVQPQENASSQHRQGNHSDGHLEGNSRGHVGSRSMQPTSNLPSWRQQRVGNGYASGLSPNIHQNIPISFPLSSQLVSLPSSEPYDKAECSSSPPDPGDWDPNYSEELLLQEDGSDVSSLASGITNGMCLSQASDSASLSSGFGRFNHGFFDQGHTSSSSILTNQRTNGAVQVYSQVEGSPPSVHDMHMGHAHSMSKLPSHYVPHISQNSPSRFSQQPVQHFNHVHSTFGRGVRNHPKGQPTPSCNSAGLHPPGQTTFANGTSWGRRAGHPITTIPPSSHARKDYGRII
ncbi:dual specificity protein kinase YAK1 homolog isoform X2 [Tasmannia lanceolata]|uniref:dual specificity protein kinase YAK1 homolog isoform X2 n=1 Tax=Tasmannia lanceolata TaxID=3420 RepID=UPI0040641DB6